MAGVDTYICVLKSCLQQEPPTSFQSNCGSHPLSHDSLLQSYKPYFCYKTALKSGNHSERERKRGVDMEREPCQGVVNLYMGKPTACKRHWISIFQ